MAYTSKGIFLIDPVTRHPRIKRFIHDFLDEWLDKHILPDNKQLYHYTTATGLKSILDNRSIWCGHSNSFNDPSEIEYGKRLVFKRIEELQKETDQELLHSYYDSMKVYVGAFTSTLHHAYFSCFCESENLLSQWREYADRGGGYNIGFEFTDKSKIKNVNESLAEGASLKLRKVIYDPVIQQELITNTLQKAQEEVQKSISNMNASNADHYAAVAGGDISNLINDLIMSFKHPAFESEQEWRLIRVILDSHEPEKLMFREQQGNLVPYRDTNIFELRENDIPYFPVKSIHFGPSLEVQRTKTSMNLFLNYLKATNEANEIKIPENIEVRGAEYLIR